MRNRKEIKKVSKNQEDNNRELENIIKRLRKLPRDVKNKDRLKYNKIRKTQSYDKLNGRGDIRFSKIL